LILVPSILGESSLLRLRCDRYSKANIAELPRASPLADPFRKEMKLRDEFKWAFSIAKKAVGLHVPCRSTGYYSFLNIHASLSCLQSNF
jgi:hypothetical protein